MLALDAAVKQSPDLNARYGKMIAGRAWAFTPFSLLLISAIVIASQHFKSHPTSASNEPAVVQPATPDGPSSDSHAAVQSDAKVPAEKRVFVGFGPMHLMEMSKKNTPAESEAILKLYAGKWLKIDNELFSGAFRMSAPQFGGTDKQYVSLSVKVGKDYIVSCKLTDKGQMETAMTTFPGSKVSFVGAINESQSLLTAILLLDPCELK